MTWETIWHGKIPTYTEWLYEVNRSHARNGELPYPNDEETYRKYMLLVRIGFFRDLTILERIRIWLQDRYIAYNRYISK